MSRARQGGEPSLLPHPWIRHSRIPHSRLQRPWIPHSRFQHCRLQHSRLPHSRTPHSRLPHSRIPNSLIPHSRLPHSRLPHSRIPHSRIPHSRIPHSRLPGCPGRRGSDGKSLSQRLDNPCGKGGDSRPPHEQVLAGPWPGHQGCSCYSCSCCSCSCCCPAALRLRGAATSPPRTSSTSTPPPRRILMDLSVSPAKRPQIITSATAGLRMFTAPEGQGTASAST
ncbi:ly6/PLAUR domain-containing protein 6 isoform X1 [Agelaius phoeniceus]|uniref:ly6/PLAUR domain-containing protein 6 isoform X1 n=1 Tax=Agelaius phoeniceus TaxID=39638 RepID=UPI00405531FF